MLGVDVGGTFTDFVSFDRDTGKVEAWKNLTTPGDPIKGIVTGLEKFGDYSIEYLRLGTTIATNALLERRGADVAYITTRGFRDIPFIQSGKRKGSYDITWVKTAPLIQRRNAYEVDERIDADGKILKPLDEHGAREVARQIRSKGQVHAVAVCLLFSYANPAHERRLREILAEELPDHAISISFDVMPRWKEYARAQTTISDAYVKPLLQQQVARIDQYFSSRADDPRVVMMKSNGGEVALTAAAKVPINLAVSGPTGGVIGARDLSKAIGESHVVTLDIGGTSTDCASIVDFTEAFTTNFEIEFGLPIQVPMIDIRTFGAGGGSIAWVDTGGMLRVGPMSAGAMPGPICYGRGGTKPTVTDANVVLGRIDPNNFLGGSYRLDKDAAVHAIEVLGQSIGLGLEETAWSILRIVNNNMLGPLRAVLTERGHDPRDFALVGFGGAGPLHVAELMAEGDLKKAIVPNYPGQFSAYGFLRADARVDLERTVPMTSNTFQGDKLTEVLGALRQAAEKELEEQGYRGNVILMPSVEMRYFGQSHELEVPIDFMNFDEANTKSLFRKFNEAHQSRYGYHNPEEKLEIVNLKLTAVGATEKPVFETIEEAGRNVQPTGMRRVVFEDGPRDTPVYWRSNLGAGSTIDGPALVEEIASVTVVPEYATMKVDQFGNLIISRKSGLH